MRSARRRARRIRGCLAACAAAASVLVSCASPAFQPKQAQFLDGNCAAAGEALDMGALRWEWMDHAVLERGPQDSWDAVDVLNPSVIQVRSEFYNLYSGFDGRVWRSGLAVSRDGVSWEKQGVVLSPDPATWESDYIAANGSLLSQGERFLYWYQAGPRGGTRIGLAVSSDARTWQKHTQPVLEFGAPGTWDESGLGDPDVIQCGSDYYLYYLGQNRRGLQRLGVARSRDGIHWQKSGRNPILDVGPPGSLDEAGLGEPAVFLAGGRFYMLYTGRDSGEQRRIGWAQSDNGVDWERVASAPPLEGFANWNSNVICDASVWRAGQRTMVWFGGGDRPSPDENLNGQIGLAWFGAGAPRSSE